MKFAYKFNNLLGTVYNKGNILFTPDGNSVISPVGNRITIYDLKNNKGKTLSLESRYDYTAIDLSPNGCILIAVNEIGEAQMISMVSCTVVHTYKFSGGVKCLKFSLDGKFFAASKDNMVFVFITPGEITGEFNSFILRRYFYCTYDDVTWIDWSSDSKLIAVGSKDNSVKIVAVDLLNNFRPYSLGGHTDSIVGCFFEQNSLHINTVSKNGQLCIWECSLTSDDLTLMDENFDQPETKKIKEEEDSEDDIDNEKAVEKTDGINKFDEQTAEFIENENEEKRDSQGKKIVETKPHPFSYKKLVRHYLGNEARKEDRTAVLTAATYHKKSKLLITAYSTGAFYLHELPEANMIHSLSISDYSIESACFNATGDWIALAATGLGQLLVWEWQSEQYVMKQQGHASEMSCIAYSPDGQYIVTGGEDSKVKLWNVNSGFCFVTFSEHTSSVTAVQFSNNKKFLVSASLDGTVRAYDIIRYRNFRTFTSPQPVQFSCVALDHSGEFLAAGGQDIFEIYLWSMKLGRLLEILSGHEGPVISIAFSPVASSSTMVSGSWDKTIKIWNCLESSSDHETIDLLSDAMAVCFNPNGEEIAVATLNGNISTFNVKSSQHIALIEGRNDLGSGVSEADLITAKKNLEGKSFTSITYSADGECLLAAGQSKNVCIYHVKEGILLKKFEITQNHSFDGLDDFISRRKMTEFGNMALIEEREEFEGGNVALRLPGVLKGDMASRNFKPEVKVFSVRFSPTGQSWAAATTEGLLIYSLDKGIVFDPYQLSLEITPKSTRECIKKDEYSSALIMALKLNEPPLIHEIIEKIPSTEVELVVAALPDEFVHRTLHFIAKMLSSSPHIEFYLKWATALLTIHGPKEDILPQHILLSLHQSLNRKYESLSKICDFNKYTIKVIQEMAKLQILKDEENQNDNDSENSGDEDMLLVSSKRTNGVSHDDDDDDVIMSDDDSDSD